MPVHGAPVAHHKPAARLMPGFLLAAALLRLIKLGNLSLTGDEAYYWLWSRNLDWAYYDHPAGLGVLVRFSTLLAGQTEFGVRWLNAVLGVLSVALIYRVGTLMLSRRAGAFAAAVVAVGAPFVLTSRFVYTNALFLCAMLCNLWAFWAGGRIWRRRPRHTAYFAFGLTLAFLFNTKYTAYLYTAALGLAMLVDHRMLLKSPGFWLNAGVAALGLVPVAGWNMAHNWASIRWQLAHLVTASPGSGAGPLPVLWLGNAWHALGYLTWPVAVLSTFGLLRARRPAGRLLTLVALVLLVPVALSPANSPRNLTPGLALLLLLAGWQLDGDKNHAYTRIFAPILVLLLAITLVYGTGTVVALTGQAGWPQSSAVHEIRRDYIDGQMLASALSPFPAPFFAVDYDLAGRIRYYTGRPAMSAWAQFAIWGYPDWEGGSVLSRDYVPVDCVAARLHEAFAHVSAPQALPISAFAQPRPLYLWQVSGPRISSPDMARLLDFLTLLESCP